MSVDVRSPEAGTLKIFHAKINDNVAVGAPLFTIDTDGKSTSAPAPAAAAPKAPAPAPMAAAPVPVVAAATIAPRSGARIPSIHFKHGARAVIDAALGFGAVKGQHSGGGGSSAAAHAHVGGDYLSELAALYPSKPGAKDSFAVPAQYGRPPISEDEGFMISSGGAYGKPPPPPADRKKATK